MVISITGCLVVVVALLVGRVISMTGWTVLLLGALVCLVISMTGCTVVLGGCVGTAVVGGVVPAVEPGMKHILNALSLSLSYNTKHVK